MLAHDNLRSAYVVEVGELSVKQIPTSWWKAHFHARIKGGAPSAPGSPLEGRSARGQGHLAMGRRVAP